MSQATKRQFSLLLWGEGGGEVWPELEDATPSGGVSGAGREGGNFSACIASGGVATSPASFLSFHFSPSLVVLPARGVAHRLPTWSASVGVRSPFSRVLQLSALSPFQSRELGVRQSWTSVGRLRPPFVCSNSRPPRFGSPSRAAGVDQFSRASSIRRRKSPESWPCDVAASGTDCGVGQIFAAPAIPFRGFFPSKFPLFSASFATGVGQLGAHDSSDGVPRLGRSCGTSPSFWLDPYGVPDGVGYSPREYEHALAPVRCSNGRRAKQAPFRSEPEAGQVAEYISEFPPKVS